MTDSKPILKRYGFWASMVGIAAAWTAHAADRDGNEVLANLALAVSLACGAFALYGAVTYVVNHFSRPDDT